MSERSILQRIQMLRAGSEPQRVLSQIGQGAILDRIQSRVDNMINRVQQMRPNVIENVMQRVQQFQPGERLFKLLPPTEQKSESKQPTEAPTPAQQPASILREP